MSDWPSAVARLQSPAPFDLLVTHWGHGLAALDGRPSSVAERILGEIRRLDVRVPVIVFASGSFARENRRTALRLGAQAYTCDWGRLFREIERLFGE